MGIPFSSDLVHPKMIKLRCRFVALIIDRLVGRELEQLHYVKLEYGFHRIDEFWGLLSGQNLPEFDRRQTAPVSPI